MAFKKFRKMKVYEASGYNYKRTPSIILKGDWLKETGFDVGGLIQVECENGKLIITPREPEMVEHLMDAETWMDANKAIEVGFADEIIQRNGAVDEMEIPQVSMLYSKTAVVNSLMERIAEKCRIQQKEEIENSNKVKADSLMSRLNLLKNWR